MARAVMIHHMNVPVDDIDAARDFYGRTLGLPEIKRPDVGRPGLWFGCPPNELHLSVQPGLQGGRTGLSLHPGERPERRGGHVAFTMDGSLDDTAGLPQIFCEDPAGNLVELNTGWAQQPVGGAR